MEDLRMQKKNFERINIRKFSMTRNGLQQTAKEAGMKDVLWEACQT